jgi:arylsulfatase A-like enzyme
MATGIDVSGAKYPRKFRGKTIKPPEGKSLVKIFKEDAIDRQAIYWEHEGNRAIRVGDWKLVAKGRNGKWELYDLKNDRVEMNDLSKKHPEKTKKLQAMWQSYAERTGVIPWPESRKKNKKK